MPISRRDIHTILANGPWEHDVKVFLVLAFSLLVTSASVASEAGHPVPDSQPSTYTTQFSVGEQSAHGHQFSVGSDKDAQLSASFTNQADFGVSASVGEAHSVDQADPDRVTAYSVGLRGEQ
jgi:hypothetical protein